MREQGVGQLANFKAPGAFATAPPPSREDTTGLGVLYSSILEQHSMLLLGGLSDSFHSRRFVSLLVLSQPGTTCSEGYFTTLEP